MSRSKATGLSFSHPIAFWIGCILMIAGVLGHLPMFLMAADTHYHLADMPVDLPMMIGMVMIPAGLVLAGYGMVPRFGALRQGTLAGKVLSFHLADRIPLNRAHWTLVLVLLIALIVDVMKPATLGFVMPGLIAEYGIDRMTAGWLPLFALIGMTVGSIIWGGVADKFGRRAAILLSALMFIGTAICGAMPTFYGNLLMCFLM